MLVALARVGGAAFFAGLWWLAPSGLWRTTTTLFAAAALGNLLGLALPPHGVVDFMYSKLINAILGQGVFNLADLYYDAALVCLVLLVGRAVLVRVRSRERKAAAPN
jgi:lipoprotein signal peptidase